MTMKAERQQKEATSRVLQQSKGGEGHIIDNRPQNMYQSKLIASISSNHVPIQMQKIVQQSTDINTMRIVEDNYVLAKGEFFVTEETIDHENNAAVDRYTDLFFQISSQEAQRARIAREAVQKIRDKKQRAERRRIDREESIKDVPSELTRRDHDFSKPINRDGQGKAHLTSTGLAPAGRVSIKPSDHLHQDHPNKGQSNLISFTGPKPIGGGQVYGPKTIYVKTKKIARAKKRGKPDAQHLEIYTSSDILADENATRAFVKKDDEHQIRVLSKSDQLGEINFRFLKSEDLGIPDLHDSDSDSSVEDLSSDDDV